METENRESICKKLEVVIDKTEYFLKALPIISIVGSLLLGFEKINNEYQLSGIYSYNLASSQHAQSRTDLKEEDFEHLLLGREFHNEDGTSYQEILEKFGLSKYIEIDSGGESGQKLNILYKLENGKYVSLWFTVSQSGDYLLYEKHIT